jgi:hypothetical protein
MGDQQVDASIKTISKRPIVLAAATAAAVPAAVVTVYSISRKKAATYNT